MHQREEARNIDYKVQRAVPLKEVRNYIYVTCNVIDNKILCMIQEELDTMSKKGKDPLCPCFCQVHSL
jgi:hypothetical protein